MRKQIYFIPVLSLCLLASAVTAQVSQVKFGKNRVQYHRDFDEWSQYESDNFITYWYGVGRNVGQFVVQMAEQDFAQIQSVLEHRVNEKLQIIVYADLTDLKQSNIGNEEAFTNTAGQTKIVGNKVFVHFNGDHNDLRRQIREGIASAYLEAMLFGANLQEIVQNAVMLNLPPWFKQGLVAYIGEPWNTELDNELRDAMLSEDYEGFDKLAEENPKLAGHSLWYFVGENYGIATLSNLLYLTRINRSIDLGVVYAFGSPLETALQAWEVFFLQRYRIDASMRAMPELQPIPFKNKRNLPVSQLKISPNGQQIAFVTNEIGKYKVYLQHLGDNEKKVLLKGGFRNAFQATDYNYPLVAWNPNGQEVAVIYEKRDIIKLLTYNLTTHKKEVSELAPDYQRIFSFDYINPGQMLFSAEVQGYSDIFLYYPVTRQSQRITQDFYDDLDASYVKLGRKKGILFASNRPDSILKPERLDSILPIGPKDIFFYNLETESPELVRVTHTPFADERQPVQADSSRFAYISDQSGIFNRELGYLEEYVHHYNQIIVFKDGTEIKINADSTLADLDMETVDTIFTVPVVKDRAVTHPNTNYNRNILEQHAAPRKSRITELIFNQGAYRMYYGDPEMSTNIEQPATIFSTQQSEAAGRQKNSEGKHRREGHQVLEESPSRNPSETDLPAEKQDTGMVYNFLFQSEFEVDEEQSPTLQQSVQVIRPAQDSTAEDRPTTSRPLFQTRALSLSSRSGEPAIYRFRPGRITPYRLQFRTDFVTTQMDNSLLFDGLDSYQANPDGFNYPPMGILLKANFKDLFEDYEIEGGVRIPTTFNGTEYFLTVQDKKKRLDKIFAIYRRNQRFIGEGTIVPTRREVNVLLGQFGVRYPLDIFRSLRATATLRRDRIMFLATDDQSLKKPVSNEQRAGLRLEYVFDNTLDMGVNLKNGSRYKLYAEIVKRFELGFKERITLDFNKGFMGVLGFDARHYQRLDKLSILALRVSGATSFGSEKILYSLGGVDNWLFYNFDKSIPTPGGEDVAYVTLAPNLRGFSSNIRNGNTHLLLNAELRSPVFRYFAPRVRSSFLRNFQVVGFFDVGTAWVGNSPYSSENPLNTTTFTQGDLVSIKVTYFRDPIVAGYGVGVRSTLFGYFVRADYGWGIETRKVQKPKFYVAFGTDF